MENDTREGGELAQNNNNAKIQTVVVADPQSRTIAQSPSFQAKKKRRQSLGGRRVSFAQPKELVEIKSITRCVTNRDYYANLVFKEEKGNK